MRSKNSIERSLFIFGIVGTAFSLISLIVILFLGSPNFDYSAKPTASNSSQIQKNLVSGASVKSAEIAEYAGLGLPIRLKIPKIYVNAIIENVGLTSLGEVGVPKGPDTAAWFKLGPKPGDIGSSVIDGHFGWGNGIQAVFDNLHKLNKGDKLYIENDQGMIISFVVRQIKSYDPNSAASDVFTSTDGKAHLNLITCGGAWNKAEKSYSKRLIVFADKENSD